MKLNKWILGFSISIVFSLLTAGAGLSQDMGFKAFIAVLCTALITNLGAFLMKHPIESISDEAIIQRAADLTPEGKVIVSTESSPKAQVVTPQEATTFIRKNN